MTTGIVVALLYLLVVSKWICRRIHNSRPKGIFSKMHNVLGIALLAAAITHMIMVWPLINQRPLAMYILGVIMIICSLFGILSFLLRGKLKKSWVVIHRICSVVMLFCLLSHVTIGIWSLNQYKEAVQEINIQNANVENFADGSYIGEYDVGYIYAKVNVTVKDGKMLSVELLEHRTELGKAAEVITENIVKQQQVKVDAVTGATNSSRVIMKAVENALGGD